MAATPPHQISFLPDTPPTPRHGPLYDEELPHTRSSARLRQRRALDLASLSKQDSHRASASAQTSSSPRRSPRNPSVTIHSPGATPKRKPAQRVQIHSPTSPNTETINSQSSSLYLSRLQPHNLLAASMSEGMLPTPVKTPKKKQVSKSNLAGRALFQDGTSISDIAQSPRKARKNRRYNGFSLESFRTSDDGNEGSIEIFTDSRDQVPETDNIGENPFGQSPRHASRSGCISGTAKRRKVSESRPMDPQVEEALRNDDGMVYVFRGKKVFRRFDDDGEEEEEIDPEDLGLLAHSLSSDTRRQFRTITRKSIKPTRLFQTDTQKRSREAEKEEEATTDIEDSMHRTDDHVPGTSVSVDTAVQNSSQPTQKKGSPFDNWPRTKSAATSSKSKEPRGQKRGIEEVFDQHTASLGSS